MLDRVEVLGDEVEPRPDDAAEQRAENHLVGPVGGLAPLLEAPGDQRARRDEGEREHDPEGLEGERA